MSREIKFRAWTGKRIFQQDSQYLASFIRRAVIQINEDHGLDPREHESYLPNGGDIEEYLMQYTGLKDKNGDNEVYEYDIIDGQGNVIGNVYETPDLQQDPANLTITGMGQNTWRDAEQAAVSRGLHYA